MDPPQQSPNPRKSPPSPPQPPRHLDDSDEDDDTVKQLNECSAVYLSLQDCLVDTNRNWKLCQKEVQALKACNQKRTSKRA